MRKITFFKTMALAVLLLVGSGMSTAATVTYTISARNTLATSGTAPSGSSAAIVETYTTFKQMTSGNSQTLTLSGYNGYKITSITLSMKSNKSAGGGNFIYKIDNGADNTIISTNAFNNAAWNGSYSEAYINVTKAVDIVCGATSTVLKVAATVNSLYCESYSLTYEPLVICTASNLAFSQPTVNKIVTDAAFTQAATSANATTAITYASTVEGVATVNETTGEVTIVGAGSTTITATQAAGTHNAVSYCASTATYTLNVVSTAPTITVTEVTVPAFSAYATETDSEIIQVSGANLTESIGLQLTGDNANLFSLSTNSVTSTANNVAVTVYYNPTSAGSHTATLTLTSAGATSVVRTLNGSSTWKPLTTPVATGASNITNAGFTANWDAVMGATEYEVNISKSNSSTVAATDLFISEYSEGTSNNKYIEIYNGTGASVDLSVYTLKQSKDGAGWNTDANASSNLPLTGTLANNDVYVVANGSANSTILAQADKAIAYNNAVQGGTLPSFNGNDAIGLFKNDVLIDVFGDVTSNVNFAVAGTSGAAVDHTIVRKSSITVGNVNWAASAGTTVENSEWVVNAVDSWTNVGVHTFATSGSVDTPIAGSPFTVTGENSKTVSGLEAGATYKYTVTAKNANVTSAVSNVISVTTSTGTGVTPVKDRAKVYSVNGQLIVESHVATTVDIYNAVGQLMDAKQVLSGKNTFTVAAKGIVFVKLNNKTTKVIL